MNRARLTDLAIRLRLLPPANFDIGDFGTPCGTIFCALGWCTQWYSEDWFWSGGYPALKPSDGPIVNCFVAAQEYFDISHHESMWLFSCGAWPTKVTPSDVANRIASLLASGYGIEL